VYCRYLDVRFVSGQAVMAGLDKKGDLE
jgi:hypothetical protein